jgi:hypothetical protein
MFSVEGPVVQWLYSLAFVSVPFAAVWVMSRFLRPPSEPDESFWNVSSDDD